MGRTLAFLLQSCALRSDELHKLTANLVKKRVCYKEIPVYEMWRLDICQELLRLRDSCHLQLVGFSAQEVDELLRFICVS